MRDPLEPEPLWAAGKVLDPMEFNEIESSIMPHNKKEAAAKVASSTHMASDLELEQIANEFQLSQLSKKARMELDMRRPMEPLPVESDPFIASPDSSLFSGSPKDSDESSAEGHDEFEEEFVDGYIEGYEE